MGTLDSGFYFVALLFFSTSIFMSPLSDRKKTRRMLLLLGAISLTPFLGSLLLYYFWTPQSFTNYGELITPLALAGVTIPSVDGKAVRIEDLRGNWVFLMTD